MCPFSHVSHGSTCKTLNSQVLSHSQCDVCPPNQSFPYRLQPVMKMEKMPRSPPSPAWVCKCAYESVLSIAPSSPDNIFNESHHVCGVGFQSEHCAQLYSSALKKPNASSIAVSQHYWCGPLGGQLILYWILTERWCKEENKLVAFKLSSLEGWNF